MRVLPIKLSDSLYAGLKYTAQVKNTTMAEIIRQAISPLVSKKAVLLSDTKHSQTLDPKKTSVIASLPYLLYQGPMYQQNKTNDELVYGVDCSK